MPTTETRPVPWRNILSAVARAVGEPLDPGPLQGSPQAAFALLVTTMISPRTKDEVTDAAAARLLGRAASPEALSALPQAVVERLIYPAGFYRTKAKSLRATAAMLVNRHGSRVPRTREELEALPGVGRKIANLVLSRAFGIDAICVDTHVHRISNRAGWVRTETPRETEVALERVLPRRYWATVNHLLVSFGKRLCTPLSPRCSECPIHERCLRVGVEKSR